MKRKYTYYVIFYFAERHRTGIGTMEYVTSKRIKDYNDINSAVDFIKRLRNADQIIMLSWRRIKNRKRTGVPENEN